ncbi:MAG: CapA family protein [Treponema sp.]|jgi:poly-gamma-glutamate synthesis protein (capsule biosynthesis protein)|nr:CapA family protein [Treponema sp.]
MKKNIFTLLLLLPVFSCTCTKETIPPPIADSEVSEFENEEPPPEPETAQTDYLTIIAAGDNLYHDVMVRAGEEGDYEPAYAYIRPLLEKADIAFINQETTLAGKDFGFSGFPQFNSPRNLGRAIAAAGFNVVNQANNHIMDKGEKAVFATMDFWDTLPDITVLGIHRSEEQRSLPRLITKNNITVGFLSYSFGTNGIPVPADKPYLVSLTKREIMAKEIDAIRPLCDFLAVSMHWGEEYRHQYNSNQKDLAMFLAEHNVDLIIGHHPHVIQPVEYILRPDGRFMLCYYSLGNLISAQARPPTMLGALAYIKIEKKPALSERFIFIDAGAIPIVTHYEKYFTNFRIYPLYAYTEELINKHRINQTEKELEMNYLTRLASEVFKNKEIKRDPF